MAIPEIEHLRKLARKHYEGAEYLYKGNSVGFTNCSLATANYLSLVALAGQLGLKKDPRFDQSYKIARMVLEREAHSEAESHGDTEVLLKASYILSDLVNDTIDDIISEIRGFD